MSGPKYSRAYIRELSRLKQLEKELADQLENTRRNQILKDIERLEKDRRKICDGSSVSECERIVREAERLIPHSRTLRKMQDTITLIKKMAMQHCSTTGNSDALLKEFNAMQLELQKLKNFLLVLKDLRKQLSAEGTVALQEGRLEEFMSMEWTDTKEKIDIIPLDVQELYFEVLECLAGTEDYESGKSSIDDTIMKVGDYDYKKRQLTLRKQAIEVEKNSSQNNIEVLTKLSELRSMYTLLGWEAKQLPSILEEINTAIAEAKSALEQRQASKYIAECIHRVFAKKGYELLDDSIVTKVSGRVEKDYYKFGQDSLINVSMSDKGQMLFEVVGDGTGVGMDESRAEKLESEMRRFCPDYAEIRETLRIHYGISLEEEHLCEPDKKYAKIVEVTSQKSERRAKAEKKKMYFDD
jgi:hypothetical protein